MPLTVIRMIRATLLYDTVAAQLYPHINVFKEYDKYYRKYAVDVRRRTTRCFLRQVLTGPDPSTVVRIREALDAGNVFLFRLRQFLDEPFPSFDALVDKASYFVSSLLRLFTIVFNSTALAGATLLILFVNENPGRPWSQAPTYLINKWSNDRSMSVGKWIVVAWLLHLVLSFWRYYRCQKFRLNDRDVRTLISNYRRNNI